MNRKTFADLKLGDVVYRVKGENMIELPVTALSFSNPIFLGTAGESTTADFNTLRECSSALTTFGSAVFVDRYNAIECLIGNINIEIKKKQELINNCNSDIIRMQSKLEALKNEKE